MRLLLVPRSTFATRLPTCELRSARGSLKANQFSGFSSRFSSGHININTSGLLQSIKNQPRTSTANRLSWGLGVLGLTGLTYVVKNAFSSESSTIHCDAGVKRASGKELLSDYGADEKACLGDSDIFKKDDQLKISEEAEGWRLGWRILRKHFPLAVLTVLSAILTTLIGLQIPIAMGKFVNVISQLLTQSSLPIPGDPSQWINQLKGPAIKILSLFLGHAGAMASHIVIVTRFGEQLSETLHMHLYRKCLELDFHILDRHRSGELTSSLQGDVSEFKRTVKQLLTQGVRCGTLLLGTSYHLYHLSPLLSGYLSLVVPGFYLLLYGYGRTLRYYRTKAQAQESVTSGLAQEVLASLRTIRSQATEDYESAKYHDSLTTTNNANKMFGYHMGFFRGAMSMCVGSIILVVLYFGGQEVLLGKMQPGELMTFLVATEGAQKALDALGGLLGQGVKAWSISNRLLDFLGLPTSSTLKPIIDHNCNDFNGVILNQIQGKIELDDVIFSYPNNLSQPAIDHFSLTIEPGTTVALVGASGSGKSTLAKLIERFYELNSGEIRLDGHPLPTINPTHLRRHILGYLAQDPILFSGTIADNVVYGTSLHPQKDRQKLIHACQLANIHDFIINLPQGYDTKLGERGTSLSGGQKQRMAIARTLIKDPKVLILDEATSALDNQSERKVQSAIANLMQGRTTLIIAHRLSTIKEADVIVVMDRGTIVEMGNHAELMKKKSAYYRLFNATTNTTTSS